MEKGNPKKKTFIGKLLRGIIDVGKVVSPQLKTLIENVTRQSDFENIASQLAKEGFDDNELKFLLKELEKDKQEFIEITKRWESDNNAGSWLAKNVRPFTLVLYNLAIIYFVYADSYTVGFDVPSQWITILLTNSGMINTAYFGSRYLEKRDNKKYK